MADHDLTQVEGAELEARASGPMPPGAHDHLRDLLRSAYDTKRPKVRLVRAEEVDEIADAVIASAFALADDDLAAIEEEFAQRKERQDARPAPSPEDRERRIADLAEKVREVARDADADGVRFVIRKPDAE